MEAIVQGFCVDMVYIVGGICPPYDANVARDKEFAVFTTKNELFHVRDSRLLHSMSAICLLITLRA